MDTRIDEIADRIYRFSTFVPDIGPTGFTFNQYLIVDEEPLLFHTGLHHSFPAVTEAIASLTPLESLRWITFGHLEADESGSMNELLEVAPHAEVAHGVMGCLVSLNDLALRPPVQLADGEIIELGAHAFVTSTHHTYPTVGKPGCCSRRRPAPCCAATSSHNWVMDPP
ncbi:MAG TPA: hypothetical protein VNG12_02900 [Acidimicrobiales bacterium]|nr:hypothetical protein [Acidimicrobiales bacterium]